MHYYQFNIADYRKDTVHLSMLEHGAYRQLLDWHYLEQAPIPLETEVVFRRLCARTDMDKLAIEVVLNEMFIYTADGYIQRRVMLEIERFELKASKARVNGLAGGRPKKPTETKVVISGLSKITQPKANSLTHKPINLITNSRATRLPNDWIIPNEYIEYISSKRPDLDFKHVAEMFKNYWVAKSGSNATKLDWFATWKNWVLKQDVSKSISSVKNNWKDGSFV